MDIKKSLYVAASGMRVQSDRMRVVAQNIANADTTGNTPGSDPYRRKTISFKNVYDKEMGTEIVKTDKYGFDKSDFQRRFEPNHPAADSAGYVKLPNVNTQIENADMREALRSYEANLGVIETTKTMLNRTIELMR